MLSGFEGLTLKDLVVMAKWTHLYPSRTQKLSTLAVTIAAPAVVKITRCQVGLTIVGPFFCFFSCFPISSDDREETVTEAKMKDAERKKVRIGQETIERSSEKEKREDEKKR